MTDFRTKFTKWYYRKGYRMTWKPGDYEITFDCPFYVRPLGWLFFSPSTYYREDFYNIGAGIEDGLSGDRIDFTDLYNNIFIHEEEDTDDAYFEEGV